MGDDGWKIYYATALGEVCFDMELEVKQFFFKAEMMRYFQNYKAGSPEVAYNGCIEKLVNEKVATKETIFEFIRDKMGWQEVIRKIEEIESRRHGMETNYNLQ